jgi:hypothetical protein
VQDVAGDIGEQEIPAAIAIRELEVIDLHQVKDGRVNIVNVNRLLDNFETEIIGPSSVMPPLGAAFTETAAGSL